MSPDASGPEQTQAKQPPKKKAGPKALTSSDKLDMMLNQNPPAGLATAGLARDAFAGHRPHLGKLSET